MKNNEIKDQKKFTMRCSKELWKKLAIKAVGLEISKQALILHYIEAGIMCDVDILDDDEMKTKKRGFT